MSMATFEQRRARFGERLRDFREEAGFNGRDFARELGEGWTQSKVSKLETGKQTPTEDDVVDWLLTLGTAEPVVDQVLDDLRRLRGEEVSWRRQLRNGHRRRQAQIARMEETSSVIRGASVTCVPGLLQTVNYARTMFTTQAELHETRRDVDAAVQQRLRRQQILYQSDKRVEILVTETALLHPIASPADMVTQLDRLITAVDLPTVRFGVLAAARQLPHALLNSYWILDTHVFVETVTTELRINDPDQLATYHRLTDRLWQTAAEGDEARRILRRIGEGYPSNHES